MPRSLGRATHHSRLLPPATPAATMKVQALFGGSKSVKASKAKAPVKAPKGGKATKGWFGGEGGSQTSLDKWYGEHSGGWAPGPGRHLRGAMPS